MKKRFFALLCVLALLLPAVPRAGALEEEARRASETLQTLGILDASCALFGERLTTTADRLTAVTLLVRLSGADTSAAGTAPFSDVPAASAQIVAYAASKGWVGGVKPGVFGSTQPVTANAWFTMVLRMLGYNDKGGDFAVSDAAKFAQRTGVVSRAYSGNLTGGDLADSAMDLLWARTKDGGVTVSSRLLSLGRCSREEMKAAGLLRQELTVREAADRHMAAVFCLDLFYEQDSVDKNESDSQASGFFITTDGVAATNYHSIDKAIYGIATLSTGEKYEVKSVLWYDVDMDLALLQISRTSLENKTTSAFARLDIVGTADIRPGDVVYTLSNPLGMGLAVSSGVISAIARNVERYSLPCVMNTADISFGSSGGALLNIYGRVIAVTSGAYRQGNNMYLAVPADKIKELSNNPGALQPGKTLAAVAKEQEKMSDVDLAGSENTQRGTTGVSTGSMGASAGSGVSAAAGKPSSAGTGTSTSTGASGGTGSSAGTSGSGTGGASSGGGGTAGKSAGSSGSSVAKPRSNLASTDRYTSRNK